MENGMSIIVEDTSGLASFIPQYTTVFLVFFVICALMIVTAFMFKKTDPLKISSFAQNLIEWMFEYFEDMVETLMGENNVRTFTPMAIVMFVSIMISNMAAFFFMSEAAFANPLYTFTWSFSVMFFWSGYAIYKTGVRKWLRNAFVGEYAILAPIETMGYLTKPISMGARLVGNISAGSAIMLALYYVPVLVGGGIGLVITPFVGVAAGFLGMYFSILGPFIQATVFTYLTLANINILIEEE